MVKYLFVRRRPSSSLFPARFLRAVSPRRPRYIVIKWSPFGGARTPVYYVAGLLSPFALAHARHDTTARTQPGSSTRGFALLFTSAGHAIFGRALPADRIRHGDSMVEQSCELPAFCKRRQTRRNIARRGQATGSSLSRVSFECDA